MPLYEYKCESCAHRFERIQKFSDPPVETCPQCGGAVKKLLSSPAIQFKGSGWYITDYAKKSGAPASESKSGGESSGGSESKTESTSESKSDTASKPKSDASAKSD